MPEKLGEFIREIREANPEYRSLRHFAQTLQRSPSWVSKVERNLEVPSRETLTEIARLLNIDADELFARAEVVDPALERTLIERHEVTQLLREVQDMTPTQVRHLAQQARTIKENQPEE